MKNFVRTSFTRLPYDFSKSRVYSSAILERYLRENEFTRYGELACAVFDHLYPALPKVNNVQALRLVALRSQRKTVGIYNLPVGLNQAFDLEFVFSDAKELTYKTKVVKSLTLRSLNCVVWEDERNRQYITIGLNYTEAQRFDLPYNPESVFVICGLILQNLIRFRDNKIRGVIDIPYLRSPVAETFKDMPPFSCLRYHYKLWHIDSGIWRHFSNILSSNLSPTLVNYACSTFEVERETVISRQVFGAEPGRKSCLIR